MELRTDLRTERWTEAEIVDWGGVEIAGGIDDWAVDWTELMTELVAVAWVDICTEDWSDDWSAGGEDDWNIHWAEDWALSRRLNV